MLYLFRQDTTFVEVTSRVRIGRGMQCELMLPSSRASREHAEGGAPRASGIDYR
jgi:pSer/pThr/pTyr-binding forkhead associated (FHA) protein